MLCLGGGNAPGELGCARPGPALGCNGCGGVRGVTRALVDFWGDGYCMVLGWFSPCNFFSTCASPLSLICCAALRRRLTWPTMLINRAALP